MPDYTNNRTRRFSYTEPILYMGESYPSTKTDIVNDRGLTSSGTIFAANNGEYYTLDSNGNAMPAIISEELPEVEVRPSQDEMLSAAFNRYLTMSNDKSRVNNVPHREYNTHLRNNALRGAREHGLWDKEHPNLAAWRDFATAVPFGVAAVPLAGGLATTAGEIAGETALGQKAIDKAVTFMTNPLVEMANTSIGIGFASVGAKDAIHGNFTPSTALDLLGFPLALKSSLSLVDKFARNNSIRDILSETPIPIALKKEGARRYTDFINSSEYLNRLKEARLENYGSDIKYLTNRRLNGIGFFPGRRLNIINGKPGTQGLSSTFKRFGIKGSNYGITLQNGLYPNEIMPILDHEIAHWATKNIGVTNKGFLGDMMRYNESIAPNKSWNDVLKANVNKYPSMTIDDANELEKFYNYWIDPQEKRARAMAIYQQAKDNNMTTDEFVDSWIDSNGEIYEFAPDQLRDLAEIFTINNLKKYLNKFLGLSAPIGVSVPLLNNNKTQKDYDRH